MANRSSSKAARLIEQAVARGELIDDTAARHDIDIDFAYRVVDVMDADADAWPGINGALRAELTRVQENKAWAEHCERTKALVERRALLEGGDLERMVSYWQFRLQEFLASACRPPR